MKILNDGSVVPSYLGVEGKGIVRSMGEFDTFTLLVGEVKEVIHPSSPKSVNKKFTQYRCKVQYRRGSDAAASVEFPNCLLMNQFGGVADKVSYTLRADSKKDVDFGIGSKVLILCINGESASAYIVGGIRDAEQDSKDSQENGHHYLFQFNGISFAINDDGEAKLVFRGATDSADNLREGADEAASPTTVAITKNGNLKISTKDDAQFLNIDHENKKIEILADTEWNVKVNEKAIIDIGKNLEITGGSQFKCSIQNDIDINASAGKIDIGASGNVNIKSAGLMVGQATDSMLKGTTYRTAQNILNSQLMSALSQLSGFLTTAGVGLTTAAGLHSIPIAGPIAGAVPLSTAAIAISSAVSAVAQMISALTAFEGQSATYLSLVNKSD